MWASFGSLSVVPWILFAQMSWGMDAAPVITALPPPERAVEVKDHTGVFSSDAGRRAREELERVHRQHRTPALIETIDSLDGAWIADVARRRARMARPDQLYILVVGGEREVGVIAARHGPSSRLSDQQRETIRQAFLGPLQAGEADRALEQGVQALSTSLDAATSMPRSATQDTLIFVTILGAVLAVLLAFRHGEVTWTGPVDGVRRLPEPSRPGTFTIPSPPTR